MVNFSDLKNFHWIGRESNPGLIEGAEHGNDEFYHCEDVSIELTGREFRRERYLNHQRCDSLIHGPPLHSIYYIFLYFGTEDPANRRGRKELMLRFYKHYKAVSTTL